MAANYSDTFDVRLLVNHEREGEYNEQGAWGGEREGKWSRGREKRCMREREARDETSRHTD